MNTSKKRFTTISKDRIKSGIRPNAGIVKRYQPLKLTFFTDQNILANIVMKLNLV